MKRLTKSVKQYFKENLGILIGFFTLCVIVALLNTSLFFVVIKIPVIENIFLLFKNNV